MPIIPPARLAQLRDQARVTPVKATFGAEGGRMEPMSVLLTIWAVLTTALVVVLIYRSVLSMHEDDQLFLDNAESHLEKEQEQLVVRMNRLRPFVAILGTSSGLLVLVMAGLWLWRGWNRI